MRRFEDWKRWQNQRETTVTVVVEPTNTVHLAYELFEELMDAAGYKRVREDVAR